MTGCITEHASRRRRACPWICRSRTSGERAIRRTTAGCGRGRTRTWRAAAHGWVGVRVRQCNVLPWNWMDSPCTSPPPSAHLGLGVRAVTVGRVLHGEVGEGGHACMRATAQWGKRRLPATSPASSCCPIAHLGPTAAALGGRLQAVGGKVGARGGSGNNSCWKALRRREAAARGGGNRNPHFPPLDPSVCALPCFLLRAPPRSGGRPARG